MRKRPLKRFNQAGFEVFRDRVNQAANTTPKQLMDVADIVDDDALTEIISDHVDVQPCRFVNGLAAGEHFHKLFNDAQAGLAALNVDVRSDNRLWAWLAAVWSHELQHEDNGQKASDVKKGFVGETSRWIYEFNNSTRWYRHLLAAPYRIYRDFLAGSSQPSDALIILDSTAFIHPANRFRETICGSPELYSDREFVKSLSKRFVDPTTGRIGGGASGYAVKENVGSIDRLTKRLNQLTLTHDLSQLNETAMGRLLNEEFDGILGRSSPSATATT